MLNQLKAKLIKPIAGLLLLTLVGFGPPVAEACGGLVSRSGTNVQNERLTAAVLFEAGRERLALQLDYRVSQGDVRDFGWVMPVPGKPEVAAAPLDLFSRLAVATTPKKTYLEELFGPTVSENRSGSRSVNTGAPGGGSVTVVSQSRVGAFDISVISATEQAALGTWATQNGYATPLLATPAVRDYVASGWFFVLAKLAGSEQTGSPLLGQSQPILLTFSTFTPIYPWKLAAYGPDGNLASQRVLPVQLFLLQPATPLAPVTTVPDFSLTYAEQLDSGQSAALLQDLPGDNNKAFFLTRYSGAIAAVSLQSSDLTLKTAAVATEVGSGKLSSPGEWLLAALGTLFYGQVALLITLAAIFTFDPIMLVVGLIALGLVAAFVIPRRPRPITLVVLAAFNFVLGTGLTVTTFGRHPLILISIIPLAALLGWAVWSAFFHTRNREKL